MARPENIRELTEVVEPGSRLPRQQNEYGVSANRSFGAALTSEVSLVEISDRIFPYWSRRRDRFLWECLVKSDLLSSATNITTAQLFSIPFSIEPKNKDNRRDREIAYWSHLLLRESWATEMYKFIVDWQGQDNGAFLEVLGAGDPQGPIEPTLVPGTSTYLFGLGFRHLDSFRCLDRDAPVLMADGSNIKIIDLVRGKVQGQVMSVGPYGNVEPKRITGWHETALGDRAWVRVNLRNHANRGLGRRNGLTLTSDHEVMTNKGWVKAADLRAGDLVATSSPDLTESQRDFLVGTMLGDGFITRSSSNGMSGLQFTHGRMQEEWMSIKEAFLPALKFARKAHKTCASTESLTHPVLGEWRSAWYPNGIKSVNRDLVLSHWSPRMLASWYMDDGRKVSRDNGWGYPPAEIAVCAFSVEDAEWLASVFVAHGVGCSVKFHHSKAYGKSYPILRTTADGARRFFSIIAPYVPPSMRYKLPDGCPEYQPELWYADDPSPIYYDKVDSVEIGVYNGGKSAAFCIDVEDNHNFIAGGIVVHNCIRTGNPEYPVVYESIDEKGRYKRYKLHASRVIATAQMPSPRENLFGVGFCFTSRAIRHILHLDDIDILKEEWLGSRPISEIIFGRGISAAELETSFRKADQKAMDQGLKRFAKAVFLGIEGLPELIRASGIERIALKRLPEGYDEEKALRVGVNVIAMAAGFDARTFLPATSAGATTADARYSHLKARQMTPGVWISVMEAKLRRGYAPNSTIVTAEQQDDEQDRIRAENRKIRSAIRAEMLNSKQIDNQTCFQMMLEEGDITEAQYEALIKWNEEQQLKQQEMEDIAMEERRMAMQDRQNAAAGGKVGAASGGETSGKPADRRRPADGALMSVSRDERKDIPESKIIQSQLLGELIDSGNLSLAAQDADGLRFTEAIKNGYHQ